MKRQLPLALVFLFGTFMMFQNFVPHENSQWVYEFLLDWIMIIGIFALALGIWSLFTVSLDKVSEQKPNWGYSYVTLAGLFGMMIFGFTARTGELTTQVSCEFTDTNQPAVSTFVVNLQLREPDNGSVVNLITDGVHGDDGLTIADNGDGKFTAEFTYDPADTQLVGLYDLYFDVSDGTDKAIDDFVDNPDELAVNDPGYDKIVPLIDSTEIVSGLVEVDGDLASVDTTEFIADTIDVAPVIIAGATKVDTL